MADGLMGERVLVVENEAAYLERYGNTSRVVGDYHQ